MIVAERRLALAGLSILRLDAAAPDPGGHDLTWRTFQAAELPVDSGLARANHVLRRVPDTGAIDYLFGYDGAVRCSFRIHGDGSVDSLVAPGLVGSDLIGLFNEAILRVVLHQRGLPSFHAAALTKRGRAILVMGDKGAGKSTLSAALHRQGWESIADDLARVEDRGGWFVFPGARDGKLHARSAVALGLRPETMAPRWSEAPEPDPQQRKYLLKARTPLADPLTPVSLAAIFLLDPRHDGPAAIEARRASPVERMRGLVRHTTPNPLGPDYPPPRYALDAIAGLARDVPIHAISLADTLDRIEESAAAVDALTEGMGVW